MNGRATNNEDVSETVKKENVLNVYLSPLSSSPSTLYPRHTGPKSYTQHARWHIFSVRLIFPIREPEEVSFGKKEQPAKEKENEAHSKSLFNVVYIDCCAGRRAGCGCRKG
jgi:hypothetical protein